MSIHTPYHLLDPSDERWAAFMAANPEANIFHHPAWLNLLAECYGYHPVILAAYDDSGQIEAGVPLMKVMSPLTGRRWVSLPFSDYCAPLVSSEAARARLTSHLVDFFQQDGRTRIELRWPYPDHPAVKMYAPYVLHRLALDTDSSRVGRCFDSTHRQNIRMAKKKGVRVEHGSQLEHLRAFYQLQLETRQRKGLPVQPWKFFRLMAKHVFEPGLGFALLAYKDDQCLAGAVFLHWQQSLMCKYAASHEDTLDLRPNNLVFWNGICWGCENGYKIFDMGRTVPENQGLREFKDRWGAAETPLQYAVIGASPPSGEDGILMRLMQRVICRSPLWVCEWAGRLLYTHFG